MSQRTLLILTFCLAVAACGGPEEHDHTAAGESAEPGSDVHADPDEHTVRVAEGRLRDLRITVADVESRPGGEQLTLLGELGVDQGAYAEVGVPVPARVTRLLVTAGQLVRRGQPLAEVTSPELGRARAEYMSAAARVKVAEAALARRQGLAAEKIVPLREVQEAEVQVAEAHATLRTARAAIGAFGLEPPSDDVVDAASSFTLLAPVGGSVIERAVVVGQMLDPSVAAFRIGDLSTVWLTVHAFERDAVRIRNGAEARVIFPALPGQDFTGRVAMVGQHVESDSRTVPVRIDVRNASGLLRPGMSATAHLPVGGSDDTILTVPVAAVQRVRNEWCVFLPKGEATFEIRPIGRGRDLAGEIEVLSGVRAGERIVVDGAFLLKAEAERGEAGHDDH